MTRLGQDEYNLSYLVKSLGDFDPVYIIGDSNDAPVQSTVFVLNITKSLLMLKSKVDFSLISLLAHISASLFIRQIILQGYKIPSIYTPASAQFPNNRSAIQNSDFVDQAIFDLLVDGSVFECELRPNHREPLSVFIQSTGKKRLLLDLQYPNYYVKKVQGEF